MTKGLISETVKRHHDLCFYHLFTVLETQLERTPFGQNTHYLQTCQEKWLATCKVQGCSTPLMSQANTIRKRELRHHAIHFYAF